MMQRAEEQNMIIGLRRRLSTGTKLEATIEHSRNASNRAPEQQEARAGLTLTQSLLKGFGPSVNLAASTPDQADLPRRAGAW